MRGVVQGTPAGATFRVVSPTGDNAIGALLGGIVQSANALGSPTAPVRLDYFGDLECPYCKAFSLEVLPPIIQRWVRPGTLLIRYRALQTATADPAVFLAQQVAALATGRQDKLWHFVEIFYNEQREEGTGYVTDAYLEGIADQIAGLDLARWTRDRGDPELAGAIAHDEQAAGSAGLGGTPSFLIGPSAGTMERFSPAEPGSFDTTIESLLRAP
jgi:protein-disulfide isomerase